MNRTMASILVFMLGTGLALADADPVKTRREIMKSNGEATKTVVGMLKGAPFDLEAVKAALKAYANAGDKAPALFPEGSGVGDTHALPAIWEDKADFDGRFKKLGADVAAAATAITDEASFKANMPGVLKNCGGCHEKYRAKLN